MMNIKNIENFQYITNQWAPVSIEKQVKTVCSAGCKWVQLRVKDVSEKDWKSLALSVKSICEDYNATFIINDNVRLSKEIAADGVHLGNKDLSPKIARKILGPKAIIGGTANQFEQIKDLHEQKVDYIGLGPFQFTSTKKKLSPILGVDGYKTIIKECNTHKINIPVIGIGGITPDDIPEILETGIFGIAVSSIISNNKSPKKMTNRILNKIYSYKFRVQSSKFSRVEFQISNC